MGAIAPTSTRTRTSGTSCNITELAAVTTSSLRIQTESLFHTYSQFANAPDIPAKPSEDETRTDAQLQELLEKVHHAPPSQKHTMLIRSL